MENLKLNSYYDVVIVGSGPSGLGAAFKLAQNSKKSILLIEKKKISSGGLRNDCKQNYTFPVGFPLEHWEKEEAQKLLVEVANHLKPKMETRLNIDKYVKRAQKLDVDILEIDQAHVGTDKSSELIKNLLDQLRALGVTIALETEVSELSEIKKELSLSSGFKIEFESIVLGPGRADYDWMQTQMDRLGVEYSDNIVDIGIRVETKEENYPIVKEYYDPKILFSK